MIRNRVFEQYDLDLAPIRSLAFVELGRERDHGAQYPSSELAPCRWGRLRRSGRSADPIEAYLDNMFDLLIVQLDVGPEVVQAAAALLSQAERKRAARFAFDRDRRRFTVARAVLRELLAARLGMQPESVELLDGAFGKPSLARSFSPEDLLFNVSHCEDVAVYALTHGREIGVDIEVVRDVPDRDGIAARFFSARESETFRGLNESEKTEAFFNCWTRKEAFVKALGAGLGHPLDSFDVPLLPGSVGQLLRVGTVFGNHGDWQLFSFAPLPGYVGAVAVESSKQQSTEARRVFNLTVERDRAALVD